MLIIMHEKLRINFLIFTGDSCCYIWTALLLASRNEVIFWCVLLIQYEMVSYVNP